MLFVLTLGVCSRTGGVAERSSWRRSCGEVDLERVCPLWGWACSRVSRRKRSGDGRKREGGAKRRAVEIVWRKRSVNRTWIRL